MSILFTNLNVYIKLIFHKNISIFLTKGSDKRELSTCGEHTVIQKIDKKTRKKNPCGCSKCSNRIIDNENLSSSILFTNLICYIQHISQYSKSLYLSKKSRKREIFTCGNHINLQPVYHKYGDEYCGCNQCLKREISDLNVVKSSILFTNLLSYNHHISTISSGIYLTHSSHKKELFTCGNHITLQTVNDKTYKNSGCKRCINIIDNSNIINSILFTNLLTYIKHISLKNSILYFSFGNDSKQLFTCGVHMNIQRINSKTIKNRGCKQCKNRSEQTCRECIEELTGELFPNNRNIDWLINPKTNKNLEIDCCNMEIKVGIEYNDHVNKYYQQSNVDHNNQKERDLIKQKLCKTNNFLLLYVSVDYNYTNKQKMKEYIKNLLVENNMKYLLI